MSRAGTSSWLPILLPALTFALLSTALWLSLPHTRDTLVGWLFLSTLLATIAAVVAAAVPSANSLRPLLAIAAVLLLLIFISKLVIFIEAGLAPAVWTAAVTAAWTALWALLAWALRRRAPRLSIALPLGLSSLCMALPVAAMPLVHWAGHWGTADIISPWQGRLVAVIAHACPFFPLLNSLKPAIRLDWGALPHMYAWSGLGQEIPLELPAPWTCTLLYTALAFILYLLGRQAKSPSPTAI